MRRAESAAHHDLHSFTLEHAVRPAPADQPRVAQRRAPARHPDLAAVRVTAEHNRRSAFGFARQAERGVRRMSEQVHREALGRRNRRLQSRHPHRVVAGAAQAHQLAADLQRPPLIPQDDDAGCLQPLDKRLGIDESPRRAQRAVDIERQPLVERAHRLAVVVSPQRRVDPERERAAGSARRRPSPSPPRSRRSRRCSRPGRTPAARPSRQTDQPSRHPPESAYPRHAESAVPQVRPADPESAADAR